MKTIPGCEHKKINLNQIKKTRNPVFFQVKMYVWKNEEKKVRKTEKKLNKTVSSQTRQSRQKNCLVRPTVLFDPPLLLVLNSPFLVQERIQHNKNKPTRLIGKVPGAYACVCTCVRTHAYAHAYVRAYALFSVRMHVRTVRMHGT